jgi:hypothetical protein
MMVGGFGLIGGVMRRRRTVRSASPLNASSMAAVLVAATILLGRRHVWGL